MKLGELIFAQLGFWFGALNAFAGSGGTVVSHVSVENNSGGTPTNTLVRKISAEGETFVLRSSNRVDGVETEEYRLEGQNEDSWTELITCQRLVLPEALNADEYVGLLKQRLQTSNPTAHLRVLQTNPRAAVFGIEYRSEDPRETQLAFVLVTASGVNRSREIQLVQYAIRPGCMDPEQIQLRAKKWQARFQSQGLLAQAKETAAAAAVGSSFH